MQRSVICDYCKQPAVLSSTGKGPIWQCLPCDAWVACYPQSPTQKPMGRLADAELREARRLFHAAIRPIIDMTGRRKAYLWLATALGVSIQDCDGYRFDLLQAERARVLCVTNLPPFAKEA